MRKLLPFLSCLLCFVLLACQNDAPQQPKENVEVSLSYMFAETGNITRSASSAYETFYNNQIKTKKITPDNFTLTFTEKTTGATFTHYGKWSNHTKFAFLEGTYDVTGKSEPINLSCDTLYLSFSEEITITKDITTLTLQAKNNCFLLAFKADNIEKVVYERTYGNNYSGIGTKTYNLSCVDNLHYLFINSRSQASSSSKNNVLDITYKTKETTSINIDNIPFSKGKYYIFNEIENSFDVPAMEEGN